MPHTSRRPRPRQPPKRKILEQTDGWSRVEYTSSQNRAQKDAHGNTAPLKMHLPARDPDLTVDKMREEHERVKKKWIASDHRRKVKEVLEKRIGPEKKWDVRKAVCVALGSLCVNWHTRIRSVYQFAFFMDVVDIVRASNTSNDIQVCVQEPRFDQLDRDFFETLNVKVLEDPAAEAELDATSLFFAPHLEWVSEIPYVKAGLDSPLYITASAKWIYERAERAKETGQDHESPEQLKVYEDAMTAASALRASHYEVEFDDNTRMEDSLDLTFYILKEREEEDIDDLAASVEELTV
ncbi:hypothetical protein AAFC00_007248 [Neodothiora populina]|uniref:SRR1-like domain-containing protein n=1 Tax=Neodothiora populina TaxID=2781224 RepID=A0ABR3PHN4_9PEZI